MSYFWLIPITLIMGICTQSSCRAIEPENSDPALVLHYKFDSPTGPVVKDLSAYHNDGKIIDGEYLGEVKGRQGVMRLNGTSSFIDCGNSDTLQLDGDTTIEMWVRQNGPTKSTWNLIFGENPSRSFNFEIAYGYSLALFYRGPDFGGAEEMVLPVQRKILGDEWAHIAIVVEYPRCRFYLNGSLVRDDYMPIKGLTKLQNYHKVIGGRKGAFAPIDLSEFRIYRRALPPSEIALHALGKDSGVAEAQDLSLEPNWYKNALTARLTSENGVAIPTSAEFVVLENGIQIGDERSRFEKVSRNDSSRYAASTVFPLEGLKGKSIKVVTRIDGNNGPVKEMVLNPPAWIEQKVGVTNKVLPPWTPIQTEQKDGGVILTVWGRHYIFKSILLPDQIQSGGVDLLSEPMSLAARVDGEPVSWKPGKIEIKDASAAAVELEQTLSCGTLNLRIHARLEYDGYLIYELELQSSNKSQLNEVTLNVPLHRDQASLAYGDHVFPETVGIPISQWFSGAITKKLDFRFSPNVWIGGNEHGLTWQAESDEDWSVSDPQNAISISPERDRTLFQAHFIGTNFDLEAGAVLHYKFALLATPVKPLLRDAWDLRIARYEPWGKELELPSRTINGIPEAKAIADIGVRHLFINVNDIWPWPTPVHEAYAQAIRNLVHALHQQGVGVYNYLIHQRVPVTIPEFDLYGLDMAGRPLKQYVQPWKDDPARPGSVAVAYGADSQGDVFMCPKSDALQDAVLYSLDQRLKEFGEDGVYLDGTVHLVPCENIEHGCGYRAKDGTLHPTYPVFAIREMMKRIYTVVKSHNPDGVIDVHCSFGYNPSALAYADVMYTGEQWFQLRGKTTNYIAGVLSLDQFRTEFNGRQLGIAAETLHYRLGNPMKIAATSLLHDISPRYSWQAFDNRTGKQDPYFALMPKIWKMRDEFGADDAEKLFYWKNQDYVTDSSDKSYVTLLKHPKNGTLALVSNLSSEAQTVNVKFNLAKLGLADSGVAPIDALTGNSIPMTPDGKLSIPLGSEEWKYVWLKPIPKTNN